MSIAYKALAGLFLLISAFAGGYGFGHHVESLSFQDYKDSIKTDAANQKAAVATVTTKIVTQYVPQIQVVHEKGATIVKQVKVYVPQLLDARYQLPTGFVMLHDAAAVGVPLPESASSVLTQPSSVAISTAAGVIASNYQLCRTEREKYEALWQWAVGQANATK